MKYSPEEINIGQVATKALSRFPLPDQSLTTNENYSRIIGWLYTGEHVAPLIIALSTGIPVALSSKEVVRQPKKWRRWLMTRYY